MNRKLSKSIIGAFAGALMLTMAVAPAGAQSRAHRAEVSRLTSLYAHAAPGSPAQFRLHEELDRVAGGEAPSSAAAFRLAEMQGR